MLHRLIRYLSIYAARMSPGLSRSYVLQCLVTNMQRNNVRFLPSTAAYTLHFTLEQLNLSQLVTLYSLGQVESSQ